MVFQFESISDFFAMGGYAMYVWLAYGVSLLACVGLIWQSKAEIKRTLSLTKKAQMREAQQISNKWS